MFFQLDEEIFKLLLSLQTALSSLQTHNAGLNPKGLRMTEMDTKKKNICDGDLVATFNHLSFDDQKEVAQAIGMRPDSIMEAIKHMQQETRLRFL